MKSWEITGCWWWLSFAGRSREMTTPLSSLRTWKGAASSSTRLFLSAQDEGFATARNTLWSIRKPSACGAPSSPAPMNRLLNQRSLRRRMSSRPVHDDQDLLIPGFLNHPIDMGKIRLVRSRKVPRRLEGPVTVLVLGPIVGEPVLDKVEEDCIEPFLATVLQIFGHVVPAISAEGEDGPVSREKRR